MQLLNETSVFESPGFCDFYFDLKRFEFERSHIRFGVISLKNTVILRILRYKTTLPNPQASSTCSNWVGSFILELLTRFELVTSSLPTTVEPSSPCCIRLCGVFLSKKDEVAACLLHCFRPLISPCGSRCGSKRFQDANEGRTSDSGKPSLCALSRS